MKSSSAKRLVRVSAFAAGLMIFFGLAGCAAGSVETGPAQTAVGTDPYHFAAGDKLHITVFGEDNLSGEYTIAADGSVTLPLAGNIHASGLTVDQLQQAVVSALGNGYVRNPHVSVDASSLRPYFVLGEVNKPGQYSYLPDLTVMDAVAAAQGFTYRADMSYVYIRHARQAAEREYPLTPGTMVQPGDTIRVTERYF